MAHGTPGPALLGVGSPLLDILVRVDDAFLATIPGEKGGMLMVDADFQQSVLARLPGNPQRVPGGSAGNTVFALARLGLDVAMFGKLGDDANGDFYRARFRELGGSDAEFVTTGEAPTGTCLSLITPDAERTMRSSLAASLLLRIDEAEKVDFSAYDWVYIEGYMLYSAVLPTVMRRAKEAGCRIGLDLASFEVVRDFREDLPDILRNYVDIVLANEEEASALFDGLTTEEQLDRLASWCDIAAIKLGRRGSLIRRGNETVKVPAQLVAEPVDTTAAGDTFCGALCVALAEEKPMMEAVEFATRASSLTVTRMGAADSIPFRTEVENIN